jgi:hypothetical protein
LFIFNELAHFLIPAVAIRILKVQGGWPAVRSADILPAPGFCSGGLSPESLSRATSQTSTSSIAQWGGNSTGYLCKNEGPVPGLISSMNEAHHYTQESRYVPAP